MAWTAPRTWVDGELVTAALLNAHVRDNLLQLKAGSRGSFVLLGETSVAAGTTLSISSIAQTHRHLLALVHGDSNNTAFQTVDVRFNGDATAGRYRYIRINSPGTGTIGTVASQSATGLQLFVMGDEPGIGFNAKFIVPNYVSAIAHTLVGKSAGSKGTATAADLYSTSSGGFYDQAAAITQVQVIGAVNFDNATLSLYGIETL